MPARLGIEAVIEKLGARGFYLIGEYLGANVRTRIGCSEGHEWEAYPSNAWRLGVCPECDRLKSEQSIRDRLTGKVSLMSGFVSTKHKCSFLCWDCERGFSARPLDVVRSGGSCPYCSGLARLNPQERVLRESQQGIAERIRAFTREPSNKGSIELLGGSCSQLSRLISKEALELRAAAREQGLTVDHVVPVTYVGYWDEQSVIDLEDVRNLRSLTHSENSRRRHLITRNELMTFNDYCLTLLHKYKDRWIDRFPLVWQWLQEI